MPGFVICGKVYNTTKRAEPMCGAGWSREPEQESLPQKEPLPQREERRGAYAMHGANGELYDPEPKSPVPLAALVHTDDSLTEKYTLATIEGNFALLNLDHILVTFRTEDDNAFPPWRVTANNHEKYSVSQSGLRFSHQKSILGYQKVSVFLQGGTTHYSNTFDPLSFNSFIHSECDVYNRLEVFFEEIRFTNPETWTLWDSLTAKALNDVSLGNLFKN